jgi:hypothetical protein
MTALGGISLLKARAVSAEQAMSAATAQQMTNKLLGM